MAELSREQVHEIAVESEKITHEWEQKTAKASTEALEFIDLLVQNGDDRNYKAMTIKKYAPYVGVIEATRGLTLGVHKDMAKMFKKKLKMNRDDAELLADLYLARVMENLVKEFKNESE